MLSGGSAYISELKLCYHWNQNVYSLLWKNENHQRASYPWTRYFKKVENSFSESSNLPADLDRIIASVFKAP